MPADLYILDCSTTTDYCRLIKKGDKMKTIKDLEINPIITNQDRINNRTLLQVQKLFDELVIEIDKARPRGLFSNDQGYRRAIEILQAIRGEDVKVNQNKEVEK